MILMSSLEGSKIHTRRVKFFSAIKGTLNTKMRVCGFTININP